MQAGSAQLLPTRPYCGAEPTCGGAKKSAGSYSLKRSGFSQPYHSSVPEKSGGVGQDTNWRLALGQEFVFVNHGGNCQLIRRIAAFDAHYMALAAYSNGFRQSDFRWKGQGEIDSGSSLNT